MIDWPYIYFWNRMGRKGQRCRVVIRAKVMNSCLLEFEDGHLAITSRMRFGVRQRYGGLNSHNSA